MVTKKNNVLESDKNSIKDGINIITTTCAAFF